MDVAGAFNNVHHERLIHNLKKRRLPINIAKWISSFLAKEKYATPIQRNKITINTHPGRNPTGITTITIAIHVLQRRPPRYTTTDEERVWDSSMISHMEWKALQIKEMCVNSTNYCGKRRNGGRNMEYNSKCPSIS